MGIAWTMLNPLGLMVVLAVVFSKIFESLKGYPVYILSGLIVWTFFSQSTMAALNQTIWGGYLFHKIYIPRTTFAISAIGTGVVNLFFSIFPLLFILIFLRMKLSLSILFIPIPILLLACFSLGLGLIISTLAIRFPDIAEMYQVILLAWMYLTPIFYPIDIIPENLQKIIFSINPMVYFVEIFRDPIYLGHLPGLNSLIKGILISFSTLLAGWFVFTKYKNDLILRI